MTNSKTETRLNEIKTTKQIKNVRQCEIKLKEEKQNQQQQLNRKMIY